MLIDLKEIRRKSLEQATRLGCATNPALPLLDVRPEPRGAREVADRALALAAVLAKSFGFPKEQAVEWLSKEALLDSLPASERLFLQDKSGNDSDFHLQVERLWAIAWALGLVENLDFTIRCSNQMVSLFPDLLEMESSQEFRKKLQLRPHAEVVQMADLAMCLHWSNVEDALRKRARTKVNPNVVSERFYALLWLAEGNDWDDISLDT